jgi:hypothetical protein
VRHAGDRISLRLGPEVIEDGVSGFIVETEEEAVKAVKRLSSFDRREVRRAFERCFTARRNCWAPRLRLTWQLRVFGSSPSATKKCRTRAEKRPEESDGGARPRALPDECSSHIAEAAWPSAMWLIAAIGRIEGPVSTRANIQIARGVARSLSHRSLGRSRSWRRDGADFSRPTARLVCAVRSAERIVGFRTNPHITLLPFGNSRVVDG